MIRRVSIHPFDLCFDLTKLRESQLADLGIAEVVLSEKERRLIGLPVRTYSWPSCDSEVRVSQEGFGIFITETRYPSAHVSDYNALARVLIERQLYHKSVLEGKSDICTHYQRLAATSAKSESNKRPSLLKGFPYVLSFFSITGLPFEEADARARCGIAALLEPSRIALAECDDCLKPKQEKHIKMIAHRISETPPGECARALCDCDISSESSVFVSWAGAVLLGSANNDTTQLQEFKALETRLQIAWVMAHYAQMWSRSLLSGQIDAVAVEETRWKIVPLLRSARSMTDASISTRHSGIMTALMTSSELDTQISDANQSFESAQEYLRFKERKRAAAYESFVEVALFVLAIGQIIPLFFDTPMWRLNKWWSLLAIVPFALLLALKFRSRKR